VYEQDVHIDHADTRQIGDSGMHCESGNGTSSLAAFLLFMMSITMLAWWQICDTGDTVAEPPNDEWKERGDQIGGSASGDTEGTIS